MKNINENSDVLSIQVKFKIITRCLKLTSEIKFSAKRQELIDWEKSCARDERIIYTMSFRSVKIWFPELMRTLPAHFDGSYASARVFKGRHIAAFGVQCTRIPPVTSVSDRRKWLTARNN